MFAVLSSPWKERKNLNVFETWKALSKKSSTFVVVLPSCVYSYIAVMQLASSEEHK